MSRSMKLPIAEIAIPMHLDSVDVWLLFGGMFVLGAVLGSFFNVVAYRLPRKMSLSRPGSQCPACGHPLRWYDNVPIVGWLVLGGRCRDCKAAISPRYPLVEFLVAAATALVTWSALEPLAEAEGEAWFTISLSLAAFRLLLVDTLVCTALLEFDAHRGPLRWLLAVLIAGTVLPIAWPDLRPPPVGDAFSEPVLYANARVLAAALLLGLLMWPLVVKSRDGDAIRTGVSRVVVLALVGLFLGIAALAAIAVFATALFVATLVAGRFWPPAARFGWASSLAAGTLIWIVAGPRIAWPSVAAGDSWSTLVTAGAIVAVLAIVGRAARANVRGDRRGVAGEHD